MSIEYNKKLIPYAKKLRKDMTPQESRLWYQFLRKYPVRFQRQKTIGDYIVDFYCHAAKIVVEIDGGQHYSEEGLTYDAKRESVLSDYGLRVIRIANNKINRQFQDVCQHIDNAVKDSLSQLR